MSRDLGRLAPWREAPGSAGILTDFDGTISAIVDDPESAQPLPGAADTLGRLARRYRLVAVVSGRPVSYLLNRLAPSPAVTLVGLYGLEKGESGVVHSLPEAARWRDRVAGVAAAAEMEVPPGVYVERKGLTVVLHARRAPQRSAWIAAWADEQAHRSGLVAHPAKMSVELMPPVPTDKGLVVTSLADGLKAVCYLGDDVGDLPAFAALTRLAAAGAATLAVAVGSDETPPELLERADIVVDGPEGALRFLQDLDR